MTAYVSVRGWLECDATQLGAIQAIITAFDDGHHSGGWGLPQRHVNWTHYVFYGADLRDDGTGWLLAQLRQIAPLPAGDEDGDHVRGLFFASHEETGQRQWQVRDGQVIITDGDRRYDYLDD